MTFPAFTLYSKPNCQQCRMTVRKLAALGVRESDYTTVDVSKDEAAFKYVTETLNHQQAPVVVVDTTTQPVHWSGYVPALLELHFKDAA